LSDIFQEVDNEVRREQLKKLWDRYGIFAIAAVILVLAAVGGWRGYDWWQAKKAAEAGGAFDVASALMEQNKSAEAEAAFEQLARGDAAGYRTLAQLRGAAALAERDPKAAVSAFDAVAQSSAVDGTLRELAGIRAAMLLVDSAPYSELASRLEPLAAPSGAFRHTARELLALSAWRNKDSVAARRWFDLVAADPDTPPSVRARIDILMALSAETGKG
jgi:hypothetical protein